MRARWKRMLGKRSKGRRRKQPRGMANQLSVRGSCSTLQMEDLQVETRVYCTSLLSTAPNFKSSSAGQILLTQTCGRFDCLDKLLCTRVGLCTDKTILYSVNIFVDVQLCCDFCSKHLSTHC